MVDDFRRRRIDEIGNFPGQLIVVEEVHEDGRVDDGLPQLLGQAEHVVVIAQVLERQRGHEAEKEENEKKGSDDPVEKVRRIFSVGANPFDL